MHPGMSVVVAVEWGLLFPGVICWSGVALRVTKKWGTQSYRQARIIPGAGSRKQSPGEVSRAGVLVYLQPNFSRACWHALVLLMMPQEKEQGEADVISELYSLTLFSFSAEGFRAWSFMMSPAMLACLCPDYFIPRGKPLCLCRRDLCTVLLVHAQSKDWVELYISLGQPLTRNWRIFKRTLSSSQALH